MAARTMYKGNELYAWRENSANRTRAIDVDKWGVNQEDILRLPGALPQQQIQILDGMIAPETAAVRVDTEGGAPADELTSIAPGNLHAGMIMALVSADSSRVVTVKNLASASGIQTLDAKDITLDTEWPLFLRLISTDALTYWQEIPGGRRAWDRAVAAQEAIIPPDGVTIKVVNGKLTAVVSPYELGEFYYFRHPTLKPGFQPAQGGLITGAATKYPDVWAYLQTTEGKKLCKTEAEWQALTKATWATLADGTKVGWGGIGGAPWYVQDTAKGTLRLPDLRGMYAEAAGFDALGVGGVHGDGIRSAKGGLAIHAYMLRADNVGGVFGGLAQGGAGNSSRQDGSYGYIDVEFDISRVMPVGNKIAPRAWGALACVYLGHPAS